MWWLRNWTKTENYHYLEQGLPAVAPFPFKRFLDRHIDLNALPFPHEFGQDNLCKKCEGLGFQACTPDYLDVVMGFMLHSKELSQANELWIPKTREMMTSWLVVGFITWFCQFYSQIEWIGQSEDDLKAQGLIKYANILYTNQENWQKALHPLSSGTDGTLHKIEWANGSLFLPVPSGTRKLASRHPYGYLNDEPAHQPGAEATINIAKPAVRQIICVSSVAPSWFWNQVSQGL